ncbi:hypothetical protein [Maribacter sp. 2304DJ31-5]|uniref:hypothetical protein n=1 Tax=Maribacter sp. 2304DJ31-5 TaxID=3386273 RepID=UPI0039BC2A53
MSGKNDQDIGLKVDKLEDFLSNTEFRDWILNPTAAQRAFWTEWIAQNPCKGEMIAIAKEVIYTLRHNEGEIIGEEEKKELLKRILTK